MGPRRRCTDCASSRSEALICCSLVALSVLQSLHHVVHAAYWAHVRRMQGAVRSHTVRC